MRVPSLGITLTLFLCLPHLGQAQSACSTSTLNGTYYYLLAGDILSGGGFYPYSEMGKLVADGQGNIAGSSNASVGGTLSSYSLAGSYSVQSDCSGTLTLKANSQPEAPVTFQITDGGEGAVISYSQQSAVVVGRAYRSDGAGQCLTASLNGRYAYLLAGTQYVSGNAYFYSQAGNATADGNGNLSVNATVNFNGTTATTAAAGTYSLSSDCSGTAKVTNQSGTANYSVAIVGSGDSVIFFDMDTNLTVSGTAEQQFTSLQPSVLSISHIADGGGWRSSIILTNTGTTPATYNINFWTDAGVPYIPSLVSGTATGSIPVGGSTLIQTADAPATVTEGWATVTSPQSVGGTAIFRYDPWSQEAAVPLLTSGGVKLRIPYQTGNGLALGIALANPNATQPANVTEIIRDQNGNQLSGRTFTLAPLNHSAFNPTFPSGVTESGVVEYDSSLPIYALGIRSAPAGPGLAFTSVAAIQ